MIATDARRVAQIVEALGGRYLVVGGLAVEQKVPSTTEDVDLLLAVSDYERVVGALAADPTVQIDRTGDISGGFIRGDHGKIDFDLLNPSAFAGTRDGKEFFDFVTTSRSYMTELGRTADPEVVWYMRLMVPDWMTYIQKIVRDLGNGAPWMWVRDVQRIAERFGVGDRIATRVAELEKMARLAGVVVSRDPPSDGPRRGE